MVSPQEIVKALTVLLELNEYEVVSIYDGEEGLKYAWTLSPDLIILDVMMPKMDGYTFVKKIRATECRKDTPIIVLTAKEKTKGLFEIEGIRDYVIKPFENQDLLGRIGKLLQEVGP